MDNLTIGYSPLGAYHLFREVVHVYIDGDIFNFVDGVCQSIHRSMSLNHTAYTHTIWTTCPILYVQIHHPYIIDEISFNRRLVE